MTPLQRYRSRMLRLAEIANQCGVGWLARGLAIRAMWSLRDPPDPWFRVQSIRDFARQCRGDLRSCSAMVESMLLDSAADETAALLRAKRRRP